MFIDKICNHPKNWMPKNQEAICNLHLSILRGFGHTDIVYYNYLGYCELVKPHEPEAIAICGKCNSDIIFKADESSRTILQINGVNRFRKEDLLTWWNADYSYQLDVVCEKIKENQNKSFAETKKVIVGAIEKIYCMCGALYCWYCGGERHYHGHLNEHGCSHCGAPDSKPLNPLTFQNAGKISILQKMY